MKKGYAECGICGSEYIEQFYQRWRKKVKKCHDCFEGHVMTEEQKEEKRVDDHINHIAYLKEMVKEVCFNASKDIASLRSAMIVSILSTKDITDELFKIECNLLKAYEEKFPKEGE